MSSIVIEAFSEEEGNVTTEKYNGGKFRKFTQANQFLDLKQASMWFWIVLTHPIILVPKIERGAPEMRLCWAKKHGRSHGGAFRENCPGEPIFGSKTSKHVILNRLNTSYHPSTEDWACDTWNAPVLGKNNMGMPWRRIPWKLTRRISFWILNKSACDSEWSWCILSSWQQRLDVRQCYTPMSEPKQQDSALMTYFLKPLSIDL